MTKKRAPENTSTSFSISKTLLSEIKAIAKAEKRPLSNFIQKLFEEKIAERKLRMNDVD